MRDCGTTRLGSERENAQKDDQDHCKPEDEHMASFEGERRCTLSFMSLWPFLFHREKIRSSTAATFRPISPVTMGSRFSMTARAKSSIKGWWIFFALEWVSVRSPSAVNSRIVPSFRTGM